MSETVTQPPVTKEPDAVLQTMTIARDDVLKRILSEPQQLPAKDYLVLAQKTVRLNFERVAEEKKGIWFTRGPSAQERAETLCDQLQQIYDIYSQGGFIGTQEYLKSDMLIHDIRHVLLQTAFMSEISTALALTDDSRYLPRDLNGSFTESDFITLPYVSLFHDNGYLRRNVASEIRRAGPAFIDEHEDRGVAFADNAFEAWELDKIGVNQSKLTSGILATKMSKQQPKHFTSLSELTMDELVHLVDLTSYTLGPDYASKDIPDLWRELQHETTTGESFATLKHAAMSQTRFVVNQFMLPDSYRKDGYDYWRWGEGPKCLIEVLADPKFDRYGSLAMRRKVYERTLGELYLIEDIFHAHKDGDAIQVEGSLDPYELRYLATKYNALDVYQAGIDEYIAQQASTTADIFQRLNTKFLRSIFEVVPKSDQRAFLTEVMFFEMQDIADQNIQHLELKIAPLAWQTAAGVAPTQSQTVPVSTIVEAFADARNQFIKSYKQSEHTPDGYTPENFRLTFTLRREDSLETNEALLRELAQYNTSKEYLELPGYLPKVTQFDIAGDERHRFLKKEFDYTPQLIRLINSTHPAAKVAVNLGQVGLHEEYSGYSQWEAITADKLTVDTLIYPLELMKDTEEARKFRVSIFNDQPLIQVVILPIDQAFSLGYSLQDIADFYHAFPDKSRLRLVSGNNVIGGSLTLQAFLLIARENGLTPEELSTLGTKLSPDAILRYYERRGQNVSLVGQSRPTG